MNNDKKYNLFFKLVLCVYISLILFIWSSFVALLFISILSIIFYTFAHFFMWGWEFMLNTAQKNNSIIADLINSNPVFSLKNVYLIISLVIGITMVKKIIPDLDKISFYLFDPWKRFIKDINFKYNNLLLINDLIFLYFSGLSLK